jgi:glycosyltransferase involved in cell wall biosynthesis
MKRIAILLNGTIQNDYRVIKIIQTLSLGNTIHLYYINGNTLKDRDLFNTNVILYSTKYKVTFWTKLLRHSWFCFEFSFYQNKVINTGEKYDIIWANDLPTLIPAFKISKKLKCKLIYDSHEIYTETLNQFFPRNSSGIKKYIYNILIFLMRIHGVYVEKNYIPQIDIFITVNNSLLSYFSERYRINKGFVIMNFPKLNLQNNQEVIDFRKQYNWDSNSFIILYQGQLNEGRGLYMLLKAVSLLDDSFKLVIIGNGPIQFGLKSWVSEKFLSNRIIFVDTLSIDLLPAYTKGADLGVNLLESFNLSKELASPNKLFEYIHAGIPVIASLSQENKRVFDKFDIGLMTKNNPEEIASKIHKISRIDKSKYSIPLSQAKSHFKWENQVETLKSIIKNI